MTQTALPLPSFAHATCPTWLAAFKTRYVRTPAGVRRYGVPIGSPIPVGRRSLPARDAALRPPPALWLRNSLNGTTPQEREALRVYSTRRYEEINGALRGFQPMTPEIAELVGSIDNALQRHPLRGPVKLRRAVTPGEFRVTEPWEVVDQLNTSFQEKAYYSTSTDWDWPDRPIYLDVIVPAGVGLYASYIAEVSDFPYQHEVLLERGLTYELQDIAYDRGSDVWRGRVTMERA